MRKVKVEKEMPFAKVGEEFELREGHIIVSSGEPPYSFNYYSNSVDLMIKDGWLSWVEEEKTLEEKMFDRWCSGGEKYSIEQHCKNSAQIAKEHCLEVINKRFSSKNYCLGKDESYIVAEICKAIEKA